MKTGVAQRGRPWVFNPHRGGYWEWSMFCGEKGVCLTLNMLSLQWQRASKVKKWWLESWIWQVQSSGNCGRAGVWSLTQGWYWSLENRCLLQERSCKRWRQRPKEKTKRRKVSWRKKSKGNLQWEWGERKWRWSSSQQRRKGWKVFLEPDRRLQPVLLEPLFLVASWPPCVQCAIPWAAFMKPSYQLEFFVSRET